VRASCGCTAALVKETALTPADSTVLSITFDSGTMEGIIEKEVTISSNDPDHPKVVVHFTANVIMILKTEPHAFTFGQCVKDTSYIKEITVTNPSSEYTISILSIKPSSDNLSVIAAKTVLQPHEATQLKGIFRGTQKGFTRMTIVLSIDHPLQKQFEIIATAWVK
jgi:hypothetical protein